MRQNGWLRTVHTNGGNHSVKATRINGSAFLLSRCCCRPTLLSRPTSRPNTTQIPVAYFPFLRNCLKITPFNRGMVLSGQESLREVSLEAALYKFAIAITI